MSKRWTKADEDFLKDNYQRMTNKELAKKFGVTTISVQRKLSRLGLIRQVQKKWNENEEQFLAKNFQALDDAEMAKQFNVSAISIKRKLNRLGLHRDAKRKKKKDEPRVIERPSKKKEKEVQLKTASKVTKYKIEETYEINEVIFHPVLKEKGVVVKKFETKGGQKGIEVKFEQSGLKKLIEGFNE